METIKMKIKGVTPLLQHRFTEDDLLSLLSSKTNKKKDKEERTPREIADRHAYKGEAGTFLIRRHILSERLRVSLPNTSKKTHSVKV